VANSKILPTYDEFCEVHDRPTLTGKLLVAIVGLAGGGNGVCLVPPTVPRPGSTVMDGQWLIHDYRVVCEDYKLHLSIEFKKGNSSFGMIHRVDSPTLRVGDINYREAQHGRSKSEIRPILMGLWGKLRPTESLDMLEEGLRSFLAGCRKHGTLILSKEGLFVEID